VLTNAAAIQIVMGRNMQIAIIDESGASARLQASLRHQAVRDEGDDRSSAATSWPNGTPSPCRSSPRKSGAAKFVDLIEGVSVRERPTRPPA
jgi:DNA-directed RNA polymerase subunit beta'